MSEAASRTTVSPCIFNVHLNPGRPPVELPGAGEAPPKKGLRREASRTGLSLQSWADLTKPVRELRGPAGGLRPSPRPPGSWLRPETGRERPRGRWIQRLRARILSGGWRRCCRSARHRLRGAGRAGGFACFLLFSRLLLLIGGFLLACRLLLTSCL